MVLKNDPLGPADYEYLDDFIASNSMTGTYTYQRFVTGTYTYTYGNAYSAVPTKHGWRIVVQTQSDNPLIPGSQDAYTITFSCPWHADVVVSGSTFLTAATLLVQIDDEVLTGDCDTWTHAFSELRFYVDGVLKLTVGAQSDSGTGYDPRLNIDSEAIRVYSNPAIISNPAPPTCTALITDQPYGTLHIDATTEGFFRYRRSGDSDWTYPELAFKILPLIGVEDCDDCEPSFGLTVGSNSYNNIITAQLQYDQVITDLGVKSCVCTTPGSVPSTRRVWYVDQTYVFKETEVHVHRKDGPMRIHEEGIDVNCNGIDDSETDTVSEPYTICESFLSGSYGLWRICCITVLTPGTCGPPPDAPVCDYTCEEFSCLVIADQHISWPVKPSCSNANGPVYHVQDTEGRIHVAYIKDGDVWYRRSDNCRSAGGWQEDNQVTTRGDILRMSFDYDTIYKRFELYFETVDHDVFYTYTHDEGVTWFAESLIGSDMYYFYNATNHPNDDRIRIWFVYDSGTSGPGTAVGQFRRHAESAWSSQFTFQNSGTDIAVADGGMCNPAFTHSAQNEITWSPVLDGDTDPTTLFSNDEGRTWRIQV